MSNVVEFPKPCRERLSREAVAITFDDFCIADANNGWSNRSVLNGMTVLLYPNATLVCCPGGTCSAIVRIGMDVSPIFEVPLASLAS